MKTDEKLTAVQKNILEALDLGGLLTQDRQNILRVGALELQPRTREILVKARLIERLDKTRGVGVSGNGFVITQKGRDVLHRA